MKKKLIISFISILILAIVILNLNSSYKKSKINENFPVPALAISMKANFDNPLIKKGAKYLAINIGGEQGLIPPADYFKEIEEQGWKEMKEKQMGHVVFFEKDETIMSVVIHENTIQLYEMMKEFSNS